MPNTAGFDVVLELSRGFIEDLFYSTPRSLFNNQSIAPGDTPDTFAPPFSWPLAFAGIGTLGDAQIIVDQVSLLAVPRTSNLVLRFTFSKSNIAFPQSVTLLGGTIEIDLQMLVLVDPGGTLVSDSTPLQLPWRRLSSIRVLRQSSTV
jgi:hypothetical protein